MIVRNNYKMNVALINREIMELTDFLDDCISNLSLVDIYVTEASYITNLVKRT